MSRVATPGFNDPKFWVKRMKTILKSPYISPEYRARCEALLHSELHKLQNPTSNHYPRVRQE